MSALAWPLFWVVVGGVVLIVGADRLVVAAKRLSHYWGISTVLIGAVVVGLGTSLPEMLISGVAAAQPEGLDLAVGNIVGSNIANLSLVLGVSLVLSPIRVATRSLRREWMAMWVGSALFVVLTWWGNDLHRWEGAILAIAMVGALVLLYVWSRDAEHNAVGAAEPDNRDRGGPVQPAREILVALASLALTLAGADRFVFGATEIAEGIGVSGGFIGLTLVALGTSLPELATAVAAARRGDNELVLGNVLGSNLFNALAVGGVAGLVGNGAITEKFENFQGSLLWMMGTALAAGGLVSSRWSKSRMGGIVLVAFYPMALLIARL